MQFVTASIPLTNQRSEAEQSEAGGGSMYDKMFKATGGARMGMRARASQNGKLARTEGGVDGADGAPPATAVKQEGQRLGSHKRKRAVDTDGVAAAQVPASAEEVVVKQEKASSAAKTVAKQEAGGEPKAPNAGTKAERKREREAKKANKQAGKGEKKEEEQEEGENGQARSEKEEKARKKKKKRGGKGA